MRNFVYFFREIVSSHTGATALPQAQQLDLAPAKSLPSLDQKQNKDVGLAVLHQSYRSIIEKWDK